MYALVDVRCFIIFCLIHIQIGVYTLRLLLPRRLRCNFPLIAKNVCALCIWLMTFNLGKSGNFFQAKHSTLEETPTFLNNNILHWILYTKYPNTTCITNSELSKMNLSNHNSQVLNPSWWIIKKMISHVEVILDSWPNIELVEQNSISIGSSLGPRVP